ncbi:hypothetical protein EEL32_20630 [Brevibacillus laterosporus]|uniref:Uncharacterized protein n=1 Tax=Brevibacillus laterosporus TaxID=1465 RepID=A0A502I4X1_BRELA|nr:hypothetical protein [Brevibacillus laterosporus]QDX94022.1 hypothetical protein EEL30_18035 [Brevibacillus laterosporus]TPG67980.1 hypothetical protein EEL31_05010 [Brevibacillus laterosporus]TPG81305.1 hypothetical protein EEL32_20630 [Brevibacillus laterosporus]
MVKKSSVILLLCFFLLVSCEEAGNKIQRDPPVPAPLELSKSPQSKQYLKDQKIIDGLKITKISAQQAVSKGESGEFKGVAFYIEFTDDEKPLRPEYLKKITFEIVFNESQSELLQYFSASMSVPATLDTNKGLYLASAGIFGIEEAEIKKFLYSKQKLNVKVYYNQDLVHQQELDFESQSGK